MQQFSAMRMTLLIVGALEHAFADLPVHCVRHQVVGEWEFTLGALGPKRSSCGHTKPDNPYRQPHMKVLENTGPITKRKMTLSDPSTVTAEDGSVGTWTMIYDEGFEVAVGGEVFFAFSNFSFTDADRQHNVSHCGETQIGWYRDATRSRWGCYVGKKAGVKAADEAAPAAKPIAKVSQGPRMSLEAFGSALASVAPPQENKRKGTEFLTSWLDASDKMASTADEADEAPADVDAQKQGKEADDSFVTPPVYKPWVPSSAGFEKPMEGAWQQSVASALNFLQLGWTASAYKKFNGRSPKEMNRYAGVRRTRGERKRSEETFTSFLGTSRKVRHSSFESKNFDWRRKDDKNWLTPVVSQGDCGSCYTISTVHMLTARNRIHSGSTEEPSFSVSFPLYCSEYTQGCDGGYGFLQSKWTEDIGLVPESCAPFSTGGGSCQVLAGCDLSGSQGAHANKRYRASRHHYVGGYYGASDADSIKKELVERGPVVMSFEPKEDFMYYKSGVYRSGAEKIHQEWEQVDHAVLLIGYGVEEKHKYWTMQNSWGTDWGEDGYFRMERGQDESGCESIVVSADVIQENGNPVLENFIATL
jgi:cathepsin C